MSATIKQVEYIQSLLNTLAVNQERVMDTHRNAKDASLEGPDRHSRRTYDAASTLRDLFMACQVPANLTQTQASELITHLKKGNLTVIDSWLDGHASAELLGIADYIGEHGNEIEEAAA